MEDHCWTDGRCVVALLSSDLEVVVHEPRRDHTHGKYQQVS